MRAGADAVASDARAHAPARGHLRRKPDDPDARRMTEFMQAVAQDV